VVEVFAAIRTVSTKSAIFLNLLRTFPRGADCRDPETRVPSVGPLSRDSPTITREQSTAARLAWGFWALVTATTCLIVLGALVRANGAGLACPDWPLCFGEVIPRFDVKIAFEWGHRALAGGVGLFFLLLAILTLRQPGLGRPLRPWLALAAVLLAVQVTLGALTVWQLLASWTVTSHLVVGNAVNAGFATVAYQLSRRADGQPADDAVPKTLRNLLWLSASLLVLQLILGGQVSSRFAGLVCDEWPACHAGAWFPSFEGARGLHLFHRLTGYALVVSLIATATVGRGHGRLSGLLAAAAIVGVTQAGVGVANVLLRIPIEVTALHSLLAAALVLLMTLACNEGLSQERGNSPSALSQPA